MAYVDILATESRGMYSPPTGGAPQMLPDYWRNAPGEEPRTDLPDLSDEELNALGWKGPISLDFDFYTKNAVWNTETREWDVVELSDYEKEQRLDYRKFWNDFIDTSAYAKLKQTASESLSVNIIMTEFISVITDAKTLNKHEGEHANATKIQSVISEILSNVAFTTEELAEFTTAFNGSGMHSMYTLA